MAGSESTDRWSRAKELFERAVELPPAERADFVARECAQDPDLLSEVTGLLRADAAPAGLLDRTLHAGSLVLEPEPVCEPLTAGTAIVLRSPRTSDVVRRPSNVMRTSGRPALSNTTGWDSSTSPARPARTFGPLASAARDFVRPSVDAISASPPPRFFTTGLASANPGASAIVTSAAASVRLVMAVSPGSKRGR